ncbi:MAG: LuxR C-terminal-related transcriptional regulator [Bacteroidota bacterium]|nr:LuxR C-terminal-related transcriptional regulator [Bacteroidota bacterium]
MAKLKHIVIISPNCLIGTGLKAIITEYFSYKEIFIASGYEDYIQEEAQNTPDLIFMPADLYVLHRHFQDISEKIVVFIDKEYANINSNSSLLFLDISQSVSEIVDNLNQIFQLMQKVQEKKETEVLSKREIDVLKLVALGLMSKQIADKLSISLNTVISHRKNITRKLGINTVSGLTVYALLNGLISADEMEKIAHNN